MAAWLRRGFVERRLGPHGACGLRMLHHTLHVATWCAALLQRSPLQSPCYAGCNAACSRGIAIGFGAVAGVRLARGGLLNVPWHEPRPAVGRCAARTQPVYASYHASMPYRMRLLICCRRTMRVDVQSQLRRPPGCRRPHAPGRPHCSRTLYCCPPVASAACARGPRLLQRTRRSRRPAPLSTQNTIESMRGLSSCCTAATHGPCAQHSSGRAGVTAQYSSAQCGR